MKLRFILFTAPSVTTSNLIDLGILLGATGINKNETFQAQIDFILRLFDKYTISKNAMLPGAVVYGREPTLQIRIGDVLSSDEAKDDFSILVNSGDGVDLHAALSVSQDVLFEPRNGARANAAKVILVLLDNTLDAQQNSCLKKKIEQMRSVGIKVVLIGTGSSFDNGQVQDLVRRSSVAITAPSVDELDTNAVIGATSTGKCCRDSF